MNDQLMSLTKIFTDTIFRIPDYQRGYAWGEKEVNDFWNDLMRLNEEKNHYVGVLTLEPVSETVHSKWIDDTWLIKSKRYQPFYVVDGQQRLTTSILLIKSIIDAMSENGIPKLNYTSKEDIYKRFIAESKDENKSNSYLFGYEDNNPSYSYLVNSVYEGNQASDKDLQETTYTANLDKAKNFFTQKINSLSVGELERVFYKISQKFLFNTYEISSDIDVFVTFETMNNRGKPLSHLELLKNRMIYLSTLFNIDDDVKSRLRRDINTCWKDIYHYLGKNKNKQLPDDEFLSAHFQLYFCTKMKDILKNNRRMYFRYEDYRYILFDDYLLEEYFVPANIFQDKLKIEDVFDYSKSLKNSIMHWDVINNPEFSKFGSELQEYLKKLNYINMTFSRHRYMPSFAPLYRVMLMACLARNENETTLLKLLKALEKYLFTTLFVPIECYTPDELTRFDFSEIIIKLDKGDITITGIIEKLTKVVNTILSSNDLNQKISSYYSRKGFYNEEFLKYFLCEYEIYLVKQSKNNFEKLDRDVYFKTNNSVEHIYPQNAHSSYWINMFNAYSKKEKNQLRNSLGNLVCISGEKNSKLGNKPFPEKKGSVNSSIGYMYGTYSEI